MTAMSSSRFESDPKPVLKSERKHVLVIGAGLVGLCSALWLQKFGHLVDRDPPLPGASWHRGVAWRVPGMLLNPLGPLAIVWRYCLISHHGCVPSLHGFPALEYRSLFAKKNSLLRSAGNWLVRH